MARKNKRQTGRLDPPSQRPLIVATTFLIDLLYFVETRREVALKLLRLMLEIERTPFTGTGKPEALKYNLRGCWSRRLTEEHRLLYTVEAGNIEFLTARYHY